MHESSHSDERKILPSPLISNIAKASFKSATSSSVNFLSAIVVFVFGKVQGIVWWCQQKDSSRKLLSKYISLRLLLEISLQAESRERMLLVPRALSKIGTQGAEHARTLDTLWHNSSQKDSFFKNSCGGARRLLVTSTGICYYYLLLRGEDRAEMKKIE